MAGALTGFVGNTSGAVPPIGTDDHPFYGTFDGNGKTIKNLWVSSDPLDWKEKPIGYEYIDVGASIGFFGNIGQLNDGAIIGEANNFYLENIEITNKVADSYAGIVVGLVNGNIQAVGVKNAKMSLGTTAHQVTSEYVLIGKLGPNVEWLDVPADNIGGNLLIDPNREQTVHNSIYYPNVVQAPDSIIGRAYYVGDAILLSTNINQNNSKFLKFTQTVTVNPNANQVVRTDAAPMVQLTAANYSQYVTDHYWQRIQDIYSRSRVRSVMFGSTPNPLYAPAINAQGQWNYPVNLPAEALAPNAPRNTICFKPLTGGTSRLSFFRSNQGGDQECISVYHYKRVNNQITNLKETRFAIIKGTLGNREGVYIDFVIPQSMAAEGYEFVVGISSYLPATSAGFMYLSFSGTDQSGGDNNAQVQSVDFTYYTSAGTFEDLTDPNYVPKKVHFDFDGVYNGNAYFNMLDYPSNDGKVYFYYDPNFVITNNLTGTVGVKTSTYNSTTFPPRQETSP